MHDWKREIAKLLENSRMEPAREAAIIEELAQHLEDRFEELKTEGATEGDACEATLHELHRSDLLAAELRKSGDRTPYHDPARYVNAGGGHPVADLWRDALYAFRAMRKNALFTLFVVVTLGFGIGANTTVFTIVNTLLLNPLPVNKASELAVLYTVDSKTAKGSGGLLPISYLNLQDIQQKDNTFSSLAGYTSTMSLTMSTAERSERLFAELATANYFRTLGLKPVRGRFFLPEEDSAPGAHPVAVMNYSTWKGRFASASDIVGKTIKINLQDFTVIGVAPPGFRGVSAIFGPDVWLPASMAEQVVPASERNMLRERGKAVFYAVGRLKPSVSRARAEADAKTIAAALTREYPEPNDGHSLAVRPISDALYGDMRNGLYFGSAVLMTIVGLILLIACSNVANLLLARAAGRKQEIAIRLAIGASRVRLVRQLLTESVLLAVLGGFAGLGIGYGGVRLISSFLPADVVTNLAQPKLDATVFAFALALSAITGLVFGIVPALRASRADVVEALKEEARTAGRSRRNITFTNTLLIGQVALSLVSLITAALFLRSIQRAYQIDPGFQTKKLAVFLTNPGQAGYDRTRAETFYRDVRARVSTLPGVASVSWALDLPFWNQAASGISIQGYEQRTKSETISTVRNTVDLDYFDTMGIPLVQGRVFSQADRKESLPVTVINEAMARKYWPHQDALGKRLKLSGDTGYRQIVGIVKTTNYSTLGEPPQSCVYVPLAQNFSDSMTLYVKTQGDPANILTSVQHEMRTLYPRITVDDVRTGGKLVGQVLFTQKIAVGMLGVFGLLALGLASIGLYGIMAYSVNRRRREIGLRMALGAPQAEVLRLILQQGMTLVGIGVALGLAVSLLIGQALSRFAYGVSATDPISLAGASLALLLVALLACYLPARGASRVDPLVALRES